MGNILNPPALKSEHTLLVDMHARLKMLEGCVEKMG